MAKKIPLRNCTGCQEMKDKREMLRIVKTESQEFFVDETGKKNGRGAYICKSLECFEKAVKNKGLERSFKSAVPVEIVEALQKVVKEIE